MQDNIKEFINIIKTRGFIHQTTDLEELQNNHKRIIRYTGRPPPGSRNRWFTGL